MKTPRELGFRMPAEWEEQESVWLAWPHNQETWPGNLLGGTKTSVVEFVKAIHSGQKVDLIVNDPRQESEARELLSKEKIGNGHVRLHTINNVDAWMRDCGPCFIVNDKAKQKSFVKWDFNAWGNKYEDLLHDRNIPYEMNKKLRLQMFEPEIVLEGGSIDVNGTGSVLTTEQCLLNKNRNPNLSKAQIEQYLKDYLNVSNVLWLKEGIVGDDTDGHIDDIGRFVSKNAVVCAFEENKKDDNYHILKENYEMLKKMKDEDGNPLNVIRLPMPGAVEIEKTRLPASYANFYIGNKVVAVPTFGHENDKKALGIMQKVFSNRKVIGINCRAMVYGLGTLHCRTQQEPKI